MKVVHANWSRGALHLWAEASSLWDPARVTEPDEPHPFALDAQRIADLARQIGIPAGEPATLTLRVPMRGGLPLPSPHLLHAVGEAADGPFAPSRHPLGRTRVASVAVAADRASAALDRLLDGEERDGVVLATSVQFYASALRLARSLMAQERVVPALRQDASGSLRAVWQPWVADEPNVGRAAELVRTMPGAARAAEDELAHGAWSIVEDFLVSIVDAESRAALRAEGLGDVLPGRDGVAIALARGLITGASELGLTGPVRTETVRHVRRWIGGLEDRGRSAAWRLCLRLAAPEPSDDDAPVDAPWPLTFHLQAQDDPRVLVDAEDVWLLASDSVSIEGRRLDEPQGLLLAELARASRLYKPLEGALDDARPARIELSLHDAYRFLREHRPILLEQGVGVEVPEWWEQPTTRLGARLRVTSDDIDLHRLGVHAPSGGHSAAPRLGLQAMVGYTWEISLGGTTLSLAEFEQLARRRTPLVRVNGQWVEVRPEDVAAAIRFLGENPGGEMRLADAMRLAYATDARATGIPVVGLEATGWVGALLEGGAARVPITLDAAPAGFRGTLRPYQLRGVSWLAFLEELGFGPCLADDMGLGKTVQLLALLALERQHAQAPVGPTLIVVPMSVVGNWVHEFERFCPGLRVAVHHGSERVQGEDFVGSVAGADAVVTTYSLAHRDEQTLARVHWHRVVLDEAQYIKNPATKQTQAVRRLSSDRRVALTGTPVENRLSELWSIFDFLNGGYLGTSGAFRTRFAMPIERHRDQGRAAQLRALVGPFILRRLKTDPGVAADLPPKIESREYCHLTPEQAELYEGLVGRMLQAVDRATGIRRRGLVLQTIVKLKQVCNHPAQFLKQRVRPEAADAVRSGKCERIVDLLREVVGGDEKALVFTQFRQMGEILTPMLRHELDVDVLFMHGGSSRKQRQDLIHAFQHERDARVLVVSLRAGGVGLNLTAATHVFHFDRWWNPAVEDQATDRAYRIGQARTVQVHKFVTRGTLEERIDEMLEEKTALASRIIAAGEQWLTELSTDDLRSVLSLRRDAVGDE